MTEFISPGNKEQPGADQRSLGSLAWQRALEEDEVEWKERSRLADEVSANSPEKQPFDPEKLAAVYPLGLTKLDERTLEGYRTNYYLEFPGTTLEEYGNLLNELDANDSN
jgi:hypothetical protein